MLAIGRLAKRTSESRVLRRPAASTDCQTATSGVAGLLFTVSSSRHLLSAPPFTPGERR